MKLWKIILVDDEKGICEDLQHQLTTLGYKVKTAHSRTDANFLMKRFHFDIAVLDFMLPDGTGLQIYKDLKTKFPHIYSIFITGNTSIENAINALNQGVDTYLIKPFTSEVFRNAIRQASKQLKLREENQRLIEENLKTRRFFEDLLNSSSEAILVVNLDFDIQYINLATQRFLNSSLDVLLDRNLQFYIADGFKVLNHIYQQLMLGKKIGGYRVDLKPEDKESIDVNLSADFLYNHDGHVEGIIISMETTSLQNELFNRILRKEKFASITSLANALAHEIRNPINILSGRFQLLKSEINYPKFEKSFEIIDRQIDRISEIIKRLLQFNTNRDDTIPETLSFSEFFESFLKDFNSNNPRVHVHNNPYPKDKIILVEANRSQFENAFRYMFSTLNELCENSLKIEISSKISKSYTAKPWLDLQLEFDKPIQLENIFEPFKLLSQQDNHSSLELAIMHTIFSNYGGKIVADQAGNQPGILKLQFPIYEVIENDTLLANKKNVSKKSRTSKKVKKKK
jgi:nitrogen-specific signal transduction histidine kinase/CheY-like chemotaxis protein